MQTSKVLNLALIQLFSFFLLTACGGSGSGSTSSPNVPTTPVSPAVPTPPTATVTGVAQKGLFLNDVATTVEAFKLNVNGSRSTEKTTGSIHAGSTFSLSGISWTGLTEVVVTGKYIDETTGVASVAPISLAAIVNIPSTGGYKTNINIFTYLQSVRARRLLAANPTVTLAGAMSTALAGIQNQFFSEDRTVIPADLDLTKHNSFANARLLLLSGSFLAVSGDAKQQALESLASDFGDNGEFESTLADSILKKTGEVGFLNELAQNIGITNVASIATKPKIKSPLSAIEILENTPVGTEIAGLEIDDGLGEITEATIAVINANANTDTANSSSPDFAISNEGIISIKNTLDFEAISSYSLSVTVSNLAGSSQSATVVINVQDENETPRLDDAVFEIVENSASGVVVGTLTGLDPDSDPLIYSIVDGNTANAFALDFDTGDITVNNAPDAEAQASYSLTINVSDGDLESQATTVINITNINESPRIENSSFAVNENAQKRTPVGTIHGLDQDQDELIYSIRAGNLGNTFAIDSHTGVIRVVEQLDAETQAEYDLIIEVTDGKFVVPATVVIDVTNVNEPPALDDIAFSIDENLSDETEIGRLAGTDADSSSLTYSIVADSADVFTINSETGVLSANFGLDAEENSSYVLQIEVSDGEFTDIAEVVVNITNVNEPPSIDDKAFTLKSNASNGDEVGAVFAFDPEQDNLSYSIIKGDNDNTFSINSETGVITVNEGTQLDSDLVDTYSLTVQVSDGELSGTANIEIKLFTFLDFKGKTPFILPLGDSITYGVGGPTYRATLKELSLSDSDRAFDFIGTQFGPFIPNDDNESEGYGGYTTFDFLEKDHEESDTEEKVLDYALARLNAPDIVLIHLGTNDMLFAFSSDGQLSFEIERAMDALRQIVEKLREKNQNIVILMAQIIPVKSTSGVGNIVPYNNAIAALVPELNSSSSPVVLVDQFTGFNPELNTDMSSDGVHPSEQGDERMGRIWFDALEPFFDGEP